MHIPDGYLSPQTSAVFGAAMVPVWYLASSRMQRTVKSRNVPLVALGAAFSFVIMMFNIPIPDGTSGHATGAALIAVLLGPWAATVAVSIALLIQALFFGDGGILAYPANAFNIAFAMSFTAYFVYRLVAGNAPLTSTRRVVAAALGGYVGINVAALLTAIEFGLQPTLFQASDGRPLYAPFDLSEAIPAMMFAHLLVAGVVEAMITAGVVTYLQRANVPLLRLNAPDVPLTAQEASRRTVSPVRAGVIALGVMAVLSPLGLLATGTAFGEDAPGELDLDKYGLQAVPNGLRDYSDFWGSSLLPDYGEGSVWKYVVSATIGMLVAALLVGAVVWLVQRARRRTPSRDTS